MGRRKAVEESALEALRRRARGIKTRPGRRTQVPAGLLQEARSLIAVHGMTAVAAVLGVHYTTSQRWVEQESVSVDLAPRREPKFVEVSLTAGLQASSLRVSIERPDGYRLVVEGLDGASLRPLIDCFCGAAR